MTAESLAIHVYIHTRYLCGNNILCSYDTILWSMTAEYLAMCVYINSTCVVMLFWVPMTLFFGL